MEKNKNIILHIGRHKSGTSSLQKFLCENELFLEKKGFYYPKNLRRKIAHHPLAYYYNDRLYSTLTQEDHKEIGEFWREIEEHDNIIISSEAFQNINPINLIEDFKNFNITVVIYVRDQISYLLSSYAQAIKARKVTQTLEEFEATVFKDMDYIKFIQQWEKALPDAKMMVQLFDKNALIGSDIRKDFFVNCRICGNEEFTSLDFIAKDQNPSIGGSLLEFKRLLNYTDFEHIISASDLYKLLQKLALEHNEYKLSKSINKRMFEYMVRKYEQKNELLSRNYLHNIKVVFPYSENPCINNVTKEELNTIIVRMKNDIGNVANNLFQLIEPFLSTKLKEEI